MRLMLPTKFGNRLVPSMTSATLRERAANGSTNPSSEKIVGSSLFGMPSWSLSSSPSRTPLPSVSALFGSVPKKRSWMSLSPSLSSSSAGGAPPTHQACADTRSASSGRTASSPTRKTRLGGRMEASPALNPGIQLNATQKMCPERPRYGRRSRTSRGCLRRYFRPPPRPNVRGMREPERDEQRRREPAHRLTEAHVDRPAGATGRWTEVQRVGAVHASRRIDEHGRTGARRADEPPPRLDRAEAGERELL